MKLTIIHFAVRCDEVVSLVDMSSRVAGALGCKLEVASYHQIPASRGRLLGMDVALFEWGGVAGKTFRLEGEVEDIAFLEFKRARSLGIATLDISQAVADALTVLTGLSWRMPTPEDLIAEKAYGDDMARSFSDPP